MVSQGESTRRVPVHVTGIGPPANASPCASHLPSSSNGVIPLAAPVNREADSDTLVPPEVKLQAENSAEIGTATGAAEEPCDGSPGGDQNGAVPRGAHEPPSENGALSPEWLLRPGQWKPGWAQVQMEGPAAVRVTHVTAYIGNQAAFVWHLPSVPPGKKHSRRRKNKAEKRN